MKTMPSLHSSFFLSSSLLPRIMYAPTFQPSSFQVFAAAQPRKTSTLKRSTKTVQNPSPGSITISESTKNKKVLVPIAFGTEEMEAVIMVDVLRRAGADVTVASVEQQLEIEASGGTKLVADVSISACTDKIFDLIALPGGMPGAARFRDCETLQRITCNQAEKKRLYGAICAAPAVTLLPWGLIRRKKSTCHPAFFDKLPKFWAVKSDIQVSGELTTSRGPGTSFQFALSLVHQLFGESVAKETGDLMVLIDAYKSEQQHVDLTISGHYEKNQLMGIADESCKKQEFNEVQWALDHAPTVLVPIANGSEEIEVVTVVDILRRANAQVVVASIEKSLQISASQGMKIVADTLLTAAAEKIFDLIILTGGNSERLHKSRVLKKILREQAAGERMVGAMCSSPAILERQGLLKDRKVTSHPSVISKLNGHVDDAQVVIDGKLITSKGLSTTTDFGLAIVSKIFGQARARSVAEGLALDYPKT